MKSYTSQTAFLMVTLALVLGIIIGMILMYGLIVMGIEKIALASNGIIQNVDIDFNETKITESILHWDFLGKFDNINYSNCNGMGQW